jgi:hypothetical protein
VYPRLFLWASYPWFQRSCNVAQRNWLQKQLLKMELVLLSLPKDILYACIIRLEPKDVATTLRICKKMKELVEEDGFWYFVIFQ